jgi:cell division protein ZapD
VLKELDHHAAVLGRFRSQPRVDPTRLTRLINEIEALKGRIADAGSQLINPLKECEFLNTIRHRSGIPGGTCSFDVPDYGYWLHQPASERRRQLQTWISKIEPLCDAVAEVLWLTREATEPRDEVAVGGFFQHSADRNEQMNLIRVLLPATAGFYPEVSAGQHRFTLRFLRWRSVDERPVQVTQDVRFLLAIC